MHTKETQLLMSWSREAQRQGWAALHILTTARMGRPSHTDHSKDGPPFTYSPWQWWAALHILAMTVMGGPSHTRRDSDGPPFTYSPWQWWAALHILAMTVMGGTSHTRHDSDGPPFTYSPVTVMGRPSHTRHDSDGPPFTYSPWQWWAGQGRVCEGIILTSSATPPHISLVYMACVFIDWVTCHAISKVKLKLDLQLLICTSLALPLSMWIRQAKD